MPFLRIELVGLALLMIGGCTQGEKLEPLEYTAKIEPSTEKIWLLTAVEKDTPVTVAADSGGVKVQLWVLKCQSEEEAQKILDKQTKESILASKLNVVNPRFNTKFIAHTRYCLAVSNPANNDRDARVRVTIKNQE
jgi:hypothetical protein